MPGGRLLGLDVGERRIGVAVSDELGVLATPLTVISRRGAAQDLARIADLARCEGVTAVVVGLPRTLAGELGPQARRVQHWADRLRSQLAVPLVFSDERYSTVEAAHRLRSGDHRANEPRTRATRAGGRRPPVALDAAAAAVLLQEYLDERR